MCYSSAVTSQVHVRALFGIPSSPGAVVGVDVISARKHSSWVISVHLFRLRVVLIGCGPHLAALLGLGSVSQGIPGISVLVFFPR